MERQHVLRSAVNGVLPRMDTESGRDWVAVYIAYHYYMERELIMKCHADFFADIDRLLPGVLKRVNKAETGADKRYKAYTDTLRLECKCWFILNECLPPMQEWTSAKYPYPEEIIIFSLFLSPYFVRFVRSVAYSSCASCELGISRFFPSIRVFLVIILQCVLEAAPRKSFFDMLLPKSPPERREAILPRA